MSEKVSQLRPIRQEALDRAGRILRKISDPQFKAVKA